MRRVFTRDKKYFNWGLTAFFVIASAILFYMALNYLDALQGGLHKLLSILSPFIWGLIIAWITTPMMRAFERYCFAPLIAKFHSKRRKDSGKLARGLSVLCSELVFLAIIAALVYLIFPQLYQSIEAIVRGSDSFIITATQWVESILQDYPEMEHYALDLLDQISDGLLAWVRTTLLPELGTLVTNLTAGVSYVLTGVYNLLIGIIVSVYILSNLEQFRANSKRWLYSAVSVERAKRILDVVKFTDRTFVGFLNGKLLDSAIIGVICYVCCSLMSMPYTLLVSVIVGVTNIIPFFGPFIGAVPCFIIILMVSPIKALIFLLFILILQQVDGNIIGPKILGSTTGINGFWVMFSIILGAGLFGFWGMLLGVPVFVVLYTLVNLSIEKKLRAKDLPWESSDYIDLDYIDPISYQTVMKTESPEQITAPDPTPAPAPEEEPRKA